MIVCRAAQSYTVHAVSVLLYENLWESMLCYDFDQHLWEKSEFADVGIAALVGISMLSMQ
jgi:hypothetical protein